MDFFPTAESSVYDPGLFLSKIQFFPAKIPDLELTRSRICIRIKEFKYFEPKSWRQTKSLKFLSNFCDLHKEI